MNDPIKLFSIRQLLGKHFFIPSYQRGYRWTYQEVEDLLDDIYAFSKNKKKSEKEFYCLQPIVVKAYSWSREEVINGWEVVDGQQRLTTIRILLAYLKKHNENEEFTTKLNNIFTIDYETRLNTEDLIKNHIATINHEDIDAFHISTAYDVISKWFEKQGMPESVRQSILNTLVYNKNNAKSKGVVEVIWYEIKEDTNAIDTFMRINMGKIPLTNAELIKALFLQERFFKNDEETNDNEAAKLRQLEIANEWDRMENSLQNDDFWWFLNEKENNVSARIEFIFDLIVKRQNSDAEAPNKKDTNATFRYFYKTFSGSEFGYKELQEQWKEVRRYFMTLEEWYSNLTWYHYIGFLVYAGNKIPDIYSVTQGDESVQTKKGITDALKKLVKKNFENIQWKTGKNDQALPYLNLSYSSGKKINKKATKQIIKELLLLFNLETIIQQCENETLIYKFPFKTFKNPKNQNGKKTSWDIEHIDSYTTNNLTKSEDQITWLKNALQDLDFSEMEDLTDRIEGFIEKPENEKFDSLKIEVQKLAGENKEVENDEDLKDNIGNLTLLDATTNRSYGNALFVTKRKKIIEMDKSGVFIPVCTKNVFLKYFDEKGTSRNQWTADDIQNYREKIAENLSYFLPAKPQKEASNG